MRTLTEGWEHYRGSLGGVWEVWRKDKLDNHFNVPWEQVRLPHCFNAYDTVDPDMTYYQGQGWYRTRLSIDNPYPAGRTLLHFEGAGQRSEVYVYTNKVAEHLGGYDEFVVDITEAAHDAQQIERYDGQVPIAVLCDNSRQLETIPSDTSDFNLYGGLYRNVHVKVVPAVSIERLHIDTIVLGQEKAKVKVKARLYNPEQWAGELRMQVQIIAPDGQVISQSELELTAWQDERDIVELDIHAPQLWEPDAPALYSCRAALISPHGEMEIVEQFGIRYFEFIRKGPFMLNGKRLLLRGTHRHDDFAGVGAAMTEEMLEREMRLIKEMGANFIRLGHYQQSKHVLDLCDRLGILVWEEIPWCRGGLGGDSYQQQCKDMLTAMIDQHRNHPSIILWGLGNENDWEADFDYFDTDEIRAFMKQLHDLSHKLDPSRLTAIRRCEFCSDIVDVYSPSIWAGWYRGIYLEYEASTREHFEQVDRMFHMEWGADNLAGRHVEKPYTGFEDIETGKGTDERDGDFFLHGGNPRVSSLGDWSETYFCDMIDWYLKSQENMNWLTGAAQWAFKDFSTPVRPDSPIPYMNLKGVVQRDLTKKEAYYVFQSYWSDKPMVRLYGHSMPVRWGAPEEEKLIRVYSNAEQAELFVNGHSCGIKQRDSQNFPCAGLRWYVRLEPGINHAKVVAYKDGVEVTDELEFSYQTEAWGEPTTLKLTTEKMGDGRVFAEVTAYDEYGVFCPDAAFFVRFGLTGEGRLLDNLGTANGSRLIQLASGRAGIYIDPGKGKSVVSAMSDGLHAVFAEIE